MAAFLWLISVAADHVWPEAKWYLIALFVALWLFVFARQFVDGVSEYRDGTDAFVHRRIMSADLPPDFRSLSHDTTVQQVLDEFGAPSRKLELIAPAASGLTAGAKFLAYEYELPYEAAVLVMPEPPGARRVGFGQFTFARKRMTTSSFHRSERSERHLTNRWS
jgi:hypothetical protein